MSDQQYLNYAAPSRMQYGASPNQGNREVLGLYDVLDPKQSAMARAMSPAKGILARESGPSRNPNVGAMAENPNAVLNSPEQIYRDRQQDKIEQALRSEFSAIDKNHDGMISREELHEYLEQRRNDWVSKTPQQDRIEDEERGSPTQDDRPKDLREVVEEIFRQMDQDHSDSIDIQEFIRHYTLEIVALRDEVEELQEKISDSQLRADQIKNKLNELMPKERKTYNQHPFKEDRTIMVGSILSVHIINAEDLQPSGAALPSCMVRAQIEGQQEKTFVCESNNAPIWNEVFTFDIVSGKEDLKLSVMNVKQDPPARLGTLGVSLKTLSEDEHEIDQMMKDKKFTLDNGGTIRLKIQWIYSKVNLLEDLLMELTIGIDTAKKQLRNRERQLRTTEDPFGHLFVMKREDDQIEEEKYENYDEQLVQNVKQMAEVRENEREWARKVDSLAAEQGYSKHIWAQCTIALTLILLIISCLVCYYKADFVNLTVCTIALYLLEDATDINPTTTRSSLYDGSPRTMSRGSPGRGSPRRQSLQFALEEQKIKATNFRVLVLLILVSLVYDILWFIMRADELEANDAGDGGKEAMVRKLSLWLAYLHFIVKIMMAFVYWKTSIDFDRLRDRR